jgi:hypothetical protein
MVATAVVDGAGAVVGGAVLGLVPGTVVAVGSDVVEVVSVLDVEDDDVVVSHGASSLDAWPSAQGGIDDVVVEMSEPRTRLPKALTGGKRPTSPPTMSTHCVMKLRQIVAGNDPPVTLRPWTSLIDRASSTTPSPSVSVGS